MSKESMKKKLDYIKKNPGYMPDFKKIAKDLKNN